MCFVCHRLRAPTTISCLFIHQMTALDCGFLSIHSQLERIYHELVKPAEIFGDDEQKPGKPALIFDNELYNELNEKLGECVSYALKGNICPFYSH